MPKFIDLTGKNFSFWTVIYRSDDRGPPTLWVCRCECGNKRNVQAQHLKNGASTSCGCKAVGNPKKHGGATNGELSLTYRSWRSMRSRVLNKKHKDYHRYGGAGIVICARWMDFNNFLKDMGERPSDKHSIDRYPDGKGNYQPDNCRWATQSQQVSVLPQNQKGYKQKREST